MYAAGRPHALRDPCREVLRLVVEKKIDAVTSAEVVQEIYHRFVHIGRSDVARRAGNAALSIFCPVLPLTHETMLLMGDLVKSAPSLSSRDLVHVATCLREEIPVIVSTDTDFDSVSVPRRIDPADADAVRAICLVR